MNSILRYYVYGIVVLLLSVILLSLVMLTRVKTAKEEIKIESNMKEIRPISMEHNINECILDAITLNGGGAIVIKISEIVSK